MKRFLIAGCLAAFLGGCAYGNRTVHLDYLPSAGNGNTLAASTKNSSRLVIHFIPFTDLRSEGSTIGEVINGNGEHTADVLAANSVPDWITEAVKFELEKAGFDVRMDKDTAAAANALVLSGEIGRVYTTGKMKYEAQVSFAVKLDQNGKELLKKRYMGSSKGGVNWAMTSSSCTEILSAALQDGLQRFIYDLRRTLNGESIDSTLPVSSPSSASGVKYV